MIIMLTPQQKADKVETLLGVLAEEVYIQVEDGGFFDKDHNEYGGVFVVINGYNQKAYKKAKSAMNKVFGKANVDEEYDENDIILTVKNIKLKK